VQPGGQRLGVVEAVAEQRARPLPRTRARRRAGAPPPSLFIERFNAGTVGYRVWDAGETQAMLVEFARNVAPPASAYCVHAAFKEGCAVTWDPDGICASP
jgi:hypothetical protein